ncbi:MAG: pyridoxal 5'-phosphate synthase, partial [Rhodococcus sp.]|nr:pyridoxal 5'-phosphate synthase [Rhodococcus sp. (in: high G+C Gram-positive bacteria)]
MRVGYGAQDDPVREPGLDLDQLEDGWLPLLRQWMGIAIDTGVVEPNAMTLATVDAQGLPVSRTVLCKGLSEDGVLFFTNYDSDKARQLTAVPYASATFAWIPNAHQVTVRGRVERAGAAVTAEYWSSRPR